MEFFFDGTDFFDNLRQNLKNEDKQGGQMSKPHIIILLCLITLCVKEAQAQQHKYNTNFTFSLKNFVDTIPIETDGDQIYVSVDMGGRTCRFCLDTGSGQGSVFKGSRISGWCDIGNVVSRDAAGRKDTVKVVQLPAFSLGKLTITGYVASLFTSHVKRNYDAILGFDIFNKGLCCKIDMREKIMILTDRRDLFDGEPGYTLHYQLKWWVPYVTVSPFKRHYDKALFDTGSPQLYTMNKRSFDEHAYKSKNVNSQVVDRVKGHIAIGNIGAEKADEVAFLKLDRLKWDDFSFLDVNTVTTQGASRIGAAMLQYGSVVINGFRHYIRFQPYAGGDSISIANKPVTTAYVPTDDGMAAVGLILPTSDGYKAGLRQGDTILAIDGKAIPTFATFQQYPFIQGRQHRLLVKTKEGRTKEVIINK